jgi:phosphate transport system permease protein
VNKPSQAAFPLKGTLLVERPVVGRKREVNRLDRGFRRLTAFFALAIVAIFVAMGLEMLRASWHALTHFGLSFVTGRVWDPVHDEFGGLAFIFGTVASSLLALVIAVPISLGIAISLSELAPRSLRRVLGALVELLAAIPSVVYGLWGIFVMIPWLRNNVQVPLNDAFGFLPFFSGAPTGYGMLAAGVVLAIMIIPTIASVSRDLMKAVPLTQREAALALGATRWETVRMAVLPYARSGIVGAIILGLGRALGETMAVTMVIGNRADISSSIFAPAATLASVIANEYAEATTDLHLSALSTLGLLLFGVGVLLNIIARLLVWKVAGSKKGAVEI